MVVLASASCNAILGLDDVQRGASDGVAGQVGSAGTGGTAASSGLGGAGGTASGGTTGTGRGGDGGGSPTGTAGTGPAGAGGMGPAGAGGTPAGTGGLGGAGPGGRGGAAGAGPGGRGGAAGTGPGGAAGTGRGGIGGGSGAGPGGRGGAAGTGAGGRGGAAGTGPGGAGGGGSCARELSTNGDFELARMWWSEAPTGTQLIRRSDDPLVQLHQITAQSGSYVLRLGAPSTNAYVVHYAEQGVDIPSNAEEVTLSGYLQVRTEEPPDDVYDVAYVQLAEEAPPGTPPFYRSTNWTNLTQANSWTKFSFPVNVKSFAGREMIFRIFADLDTGTPTYFYFDTVSVAVTRCSP